MCIILKYLLKYPLNLNPLKRPLPKKASQKVEIANISFNKWDVGFETVVGECYKKWRPNHNISCYNRAVHCNKICSRWDF